MRDRIKTWAAERLPRWAQDAAFDWHLWLADLHKRAGFWHSVRADRHNGKSRWWAALIERVRG